ncbi:MAG TPA: C1 family peptidase [Paucimonas sp.]|nr:C1 family peptidase [Paucimonas sp.]
MAINILSLNEIRSALSKEGDPWEAGATSMSSLLPDEQQLRLGVKPPPGEPNIAEFAQRAKQAKAEIKAQALMAVGVPAAYDLRNVDGKNFITPIADQGSCGSCVAFGAAAAVEGRLRVQRGDPNLAVNLSEAHLFFCHARARGANCDTGWWPQEAFEDIKTKGIVDEACYPYNLSNRDCSGLCANANERLLKITGFTALTNKPADIKQWIVEKGPVSACFVVYQDFFSYRSGIYRHVSGEQAGGHCVTIIGYNDNPGYWICKNSWGPAWGDNGYFNIAYGECGIDSWLNHGVDGIENTGWQSNKRVIGLWTINQERNAWVYFESLGWRKIASESDVVFFDMLSQLIAAKAAARPVNFYEENSVIRQAYVF